MKKLKLNLEDLKIESFQTDSISKKSKGTIKGFITNTDPRCNTECAGGNTCQNTCYNTCGWGYTCEQWTNCPNEPC